MMVRNLVWIIGILLLVGCKSESENDRSKRNADWIWWVDEHTGKGEWIKSGDQTTVKDGLYTIFYYNGNVYEKGKLKNGENVDTSFLFDTSGKKYGYRVEKLGIIHYYYYSNGPIKIYFNTGELNGEGIIANNRREKWTGYLKSGMVSFKLNYTNGVGWNQEYFDNGKPETIFYSPGYDSVISYTKKWNESGQLIFDANIIDGNYEGKISIFFDDGRIKSEFNYKRGKVFGDQVEYFENGLKSTLRHYVNDTLDGDAIDYYSDGKVKNQTFFKKGKVNGTYRKFYENGKIKLQCGYIMGSLDGVFENYDSTGKLISKESYQNGVRLN